MHGIKRTKISRDAEELKRKEEAEKIKQYRVIVEDCLARKGKKDYSKEAFDLTNQLLDFNPEFYTIWNYRRLILLNGLFPDSSPDEIYYLLQSDLRLTLSYLKIHPKVYWIWTHRKWCLENVPDVPAEEVEGEESEQTQQEREKWKNQTWGMELMFVEKMLEADARNFHAWDYRRYILSSLPQTFHPPRTPQTEIKYTTKKIEANFSNFSAWHQRTKVLSEIWEGVGEGKERVERIRKDKEKEFELVTQALWTDPGDQSGWLYHRWLIGEGADTETLKREISSIRELLEAEPDAKWPLESLVHYSLLLHRDHETGKLASKANVEEVRDWLKTLERIDGYRKERYREIGSFIPRRV